MVSRAGVISLEIFTHAIAVTLIHTTIIRHYLLLSREKTTHHYAYYLLYLGFAIHKTALFKLEETQYFFHFNFATFQFC